MILYQITLNREHVLGTIQIFTMCFSVRTLLQKGELLSTWFLFFNGRVFVLYYFDGRTFVHLVILVGERGLLNGWAFVLHSVQPFHLTGSPIFMHVFQTRFRFDITHVIANKISKFAPYSLTKHIILKDGLYFLSVWYNDSLSSRDRGVIHSGF